MMLTPEQIEAAGNLLEPITTGGPLADAQEVALAALDAYQRVEALIAPLSSRGPGADPKVNDGRMVTVAEVRRALYGEGA